MPLSLSKPVSQTKQKTTNKKNALHDHTLKMNGGALEETLKDLAATACSLSRLGMLPDIAVSGQAELAISKLCSCPIPIYRFPALCSYIF